MREEERRVIWEGFGAALARSLENVSGVYQSLD